MNFNELNLNSNILSALEAIGFTKMTPVQSQALPHILNGRDLIGQAQTGTGKTATFAIPCLQKINLNNKHIQHLIIAPTRELAIQILSECRKIGKHVNFRSALICGGMSFSLQTNDLRRKPHIVVATPGRLIQFINEKRIDFSGLETFVIDEVDEMLNAGFKEEVDKIIAHLPKEKQSLLFSATINPAVLKVANALLKNPVNISCSQGFSSAKSIQQSYVIVTERQKYQALTSLLDLDKPVLSIIFGRTKKRVDELSNALNSNGYSALGLHGDMSQSQRRTIMERFRNGGTKILVATDLAARGVDVEQITHVYNFDLPEKIDFYVHRIGRTGRAGKKGVAITLVRESEQSYITRIARETQSTITKKALPSKEDIKVRETQYLKENISSLVDQERCNYTLGLARELLEEYPTQEILVAALLKKVIKNTQKIAVVLSGEPAANSKSSRGVQRNRSRTRSRFPRRRRHSVQSSR